MGKPRKKHSEFHCYKITCNVNGKAYIGIASNGVQARWRQHKHDAKKGADTPLHRAIRKHGVRNFQIKEIASATLWEEICDIEVRMIEEHGTLVTTNDGYNVSTGGEGPYGVTRSEETKSKLREIVKRQYQENPEMIEQLRESARKQMRDPKNRELSRQGALKQWADPELSQRSRKALQDYWDSENAKEIRSRNQKEVMARSGARKNLSKKARDQMKDPKNRKLSREGALKQWQDPEYVASRLGGRHPMARAVIAEDTQYPTIKMAAEALGVSSTCIRGRIKRAVSGYSWVDESRE